jgi:hypothetical protein
MSAILWQMNGTLNSIRHSLTIDAQQVKKFPTFMEPMCLLRFSQNLTIESYPEPFESSSHLNIYFSKLCFNVILPTMSSSFTWSYLFRFSTNFFYAFCFSTLYDVLDWFLVYLMIHYVSWDDNYDLWMIDWRWCGSKWSWIIVIIIASLWAKIETEHLLHRK